MSEESLGPVVVRLWEEDKYYERGLELNYGAPLAWSAFREGEIGVLGYDCGRDSNVLFGHCYTIDEYFSLAESKIREFREWKSEAEGKSSNAELYNQWLRGMGAHLYGFGRAARVHGDEESVARALGLANEILSFSEVEDMKRRRLSPDGKKFLLGKEDIA